MATWVPAPAVQATSGVTNAGGTGPFGAATGQVAQQPPYPWVPAPGAFSIINNTTGYAI